MMKRVINAICMGSILAMSAFADAQTIYEPTQSVSAQGISLQGWGSGSIAEADEMAFEGSNSIRVSSRNFFQGGKIKFAKGVNLTSQYSDKGNLLKFTFNVPGSSTPASGGRTGGGNQLGSGDGAGGRGGDSGGAGAASSGVGSPTGQASGAAETALTKIRVVFTTSDGMHGEAYLDVSNALKDERGWFSVAIPLQSVRGLDKTNKTITSISLSGDAVSTMYLGQMEVVRDTTPVFGEPNVRELNLAFGDEVTFSATGYAGATPVKFLWDFDSSDGISVDAEGQVVSRKFRREGNFTVTLTIVDIYGLKTPYKTTINVTVNP